MNPSQVGQTFLSATFGGFPVAHSLAGLDSPAHRQAGKPALQPADPARKGLRALPWMKRTRLDSASGSWSSRPAMKFPRLPAVVGVILLLAVVTTRETAHGGDAPPAPAAPPFYAYCVELGVPGVQPAPLGNQARLLHELGFDGIGAELALDDSLAASLKTITNAGLQLFMVWTTVTVDPSRPAYDVRLPEAIRKLKGQPVTVSVLLQGLKPGDPQGTAPAVKALRELGAVAAEAGVRISIYNHANDWAERLPFICDVLKQVDHPCVGFNFNLCHWLKVEGTRDWRPVLREDAARLFCVTINGATMGAATWTHGLIRPLDEGDFDNRALLGTLRDIGYGGPVGLMCYGVPGMPRDHLSRSMRTWRGWFSAPNSAP